MPEGYPVPAGRTTAETTVRGSRFAAHLAMTDTVGASRAFVDELKREFPDASHHPYAFTVGYGATVTQGMSDDREPPGTAGKPLLAVVTGAGIGDACLVVVRWFGGTKLGTGGLVRAYTRAAQAVIEAAETTLVRHLVERVLRVPYPLLDEVRRSLAKVGAEVIAERYETDVTLRLRLPEDMLDTATEVLADVSAGRLALLER